MPFVILYKYQYFFLAAAMVESLATPGAARPLLPLSKLEQNAVLYGRLTFRVCIIEI